MFVETNQSLFDIAIQLCGSAEAAVEFSILNGIPLTDDPVEIAEVPDVVDSDVVRYYNNKSIFPATGLMYLDEKAVIAPDVLISDEAILQSNYIIVLDGQSFFDIAIRYFGDASAAFDLAKANGYNVTDMPEPGTKLIPVAAIDQKIISYYSVKGIHPATGLSEMVDIEGIFDFTFDFTFE